MWLATAAISCGVIVSIVAHGGAHVLASRLVSSDAPGRVPLYPAGDAAQSWPQAYGAGDEFAVAVAGPAGEPALALIAELAWALQYGAFLNTVALFLMFANLGLAVLNLAPAYPFDGGRVIRAVSWWAIGDRRAGGLFAYWAGWLLIVAMAGWAAFLAWQRLRFSGETSSMTLVAMALFAIELIARVGAAPGSPAPHIRGISVDIWQAPRSA